MTVKVVGFFSLGVPFMNSNKTLFYVSPNFSAPIAVLFYCLLLSNFFIYELNHLPLLSLLNKTYNYNSVYIILALCISADHRYPETLL